MRIVFLGTPEFALPILDACARSGQLVAVVAQPDRPVGRSGKPQAPPTKRWAQERGIPVEQPEKVKGGNLARILSAHSPDVAVVAAYGRILPADALAAPRDGCLNVHASLLPELRGAAPAQWAIARGYEVTGVTIMQMDEGLDTGDVRLQRSLRIAPDETGESLLGKLGTLGASVLAEALGLLERGELLRKPQDHSQATLAPILRREDGEADFSRTALELDRRRRGFTPWPGLWTKVQGGVLKIHSSEPLPAGGRAPGEIVGTSAAGIDVSCGDGTVLRLREVQAEGKKRMPASAWLSGHPLKAGECLGR
ncbi:MAG: methionyl-tRNA formyltransferase [Myxococcales bacterium]